MMSPSHQSWKSEREAKGAQSGWLAEPGIQTYLSPSLRCACLPQGLAMGTMEVTTVGSLEAATKSQECGGSGSLSPDGTRGRVNSSLLAQPESSSCHQTAVLLVRSRSSILSSLRHDSSPSERLRLSVIFFELFSTRID